MPGDSEAVRQAAIDDMCAAWTAMVGAAAKESIQRCTGRRARGEWWRAQEVRAAHNRLTAAVRRRRRSPLNADVDEAVTAARREYRRIARDAKQRSWDLFCARVEAEHGRIDWKVWHRSLGADPPALASVRLRPTDPLPRTPQQAVGNLAAFFRSVFVAPARGPAADNESADAADNYVPPAPPVLPAHVFTDDAVADVCGRLRGKTAAGVDGLHVFLKRGGPGVHRSFAALLRASWRLAVFPSAWKRARGVALYKGKGDRADPSNYRLISITSVAARAAERVVLGHLLPRIEPHIAPQQAGFRRRHSTLDNIFRTTRAIYRAIDQQHNQRLPVVFLDIAKAFDSVHHPALLAKLAAMGVTDHAWHFVRAFLAHRECAIWGDGVVSEWFAVPTGVPQGSVLAPLLYAIFINDIADSALMNGCDICLFADDVNVWPRHEHADQEGPAALQRCLDSITRWADTWRVRFGAKKCAVVVFGRPPRARLKGAGSLEKASHIDTARADYSARVATLELQRFTLARTQSYTFLGVVLDEQLRWREQARAVLQRTNFAAYNIQRLIRPLGTPSALATARLCRAVLLPTLSYGLALWRPHAEDYDALMAVLCRPLRRALGLPRSTAAVDVLAEFGIEPPSVLRMRALLALRLRYAALSAGLGTSTLASRLFVGDGALPSRTRTSTPVAAECEHLCRTVGEKQDGATLWWHRQWESSMRASELTKALHERWLPEPDRRPPPLPSPAVVRPSAAAPKTGWRPGSRRKRRVAERRVNKDPSTRRPSVRQLCLRREKEQKDRARQKKRERKQAERVQKAAERERVKAETAALRLQKKRERDKKKTAEGAARLHTERRSVRKVRRRAESVREKTSVRGDSDRHRESRDRSDDKREREDVSDDNRERIVDAVPEDEDSLGHRVNDSDGDGVSQRERRSSPPRNHDSPNSAVQHDDTGLDSKHGVGMCIGAAPRSAQTVQPGRSRAHPHARAQDVPHCAQPPASAPLPAPPASALSFPRAVGSSCAVSCASGLALAGLPLWADVSGLRGLSSPLLELEREERRESPRDTDDRSAAPPSRDSTTSTTTGRAWRAALAHVDRRVERRAQPGATHANMPSPEPSGDASPPRSSSPDSTSPHATLPHVLSHDGWHTGGVAGDPRRSADDELGHGAPHQQLQQHRNIPAPAPAAASTVLLPRPLLSPAAARSQPADYIVFDSTPAARARARLRLCSTLLDDHLALRHQLDGASAKRLALRCVLCGAAGSRRTVDHVYLQCAHPPLAAARTAAAAALRALAMDLDLRALAGVADGSDDRRAAAIRATAGLLDAVRSLLVI